MPTPFTRIAELLNGPEAPAVQGGGPKASSPEPPRLLSGAAPEIVRENIRTLVGLGLPEEKAMQMALEYAKPKPVLPEPAAPIAPPGGP